MAGITVVTPFLNAERFLGAAIGSVRRQTFTDWELLLVDDGSTDGSPQVAADAAAKDPRIRPISTRSHSGAAAARNLAIANARAPIVTFLDADDELHPDKLQADIDDLQRHPDVAMVYGPTTWWYEHGSHRNWTERMNAEAGRIHAAPRLAEKVILWNDWHVPCTCSTAIRTWVVRAVGGFEEQFQLYEDQSLWAKIFVSYPVLVRHQSLARYRQHDGSTSSLAAHAGDYLLHTPHPARALFLDWFAAYVRERGVTGLDAAIRVACSPYSPTGRTVDILHLRARTLARRLMHRVQRSMADASPHGS